MYSKKGIIIGICIFYNVPSHAMDQSDIGTMSQSGTYSTPPDIQEDYMLQLVPKDIKHVWENIGRKTHTYYAKLQDGRCIEAQQKVFPYNHKPVCYIRPTLESNQNTAIDSKIYYMLKEHYKKLLAAYDYDLRRISLQSDTTSEEDKDIRDFVWVKG